MTFLDRFGRSIEEKIDSATEQITGAVSNRIDEVTALLIKDLTNFFVGAASVSLAVLSLGAIFYILFYCVKMMFFKREEELQRIMFGFLIFLLLRIGNVLLIGGLAR